MSNDPFDSTSPIRLNDRMSLVSRTGGAVQARVADEPGSLGLDDETTLRLETQFSMFTPAQPPVELDLSATAPEPGSLSLDDTSDEVAALDFDTDPGEDAVYALLNMIETADGVVFDVTLPQAPATTGAEEPGSLGIDQPVPQRLRFPVHRLVRDGVAPGASSEPGSLGLEDVLVDVAGKVVLKRVLQVVKAPVERALIQRVKAQEGEPRALRVEGDGTPGAPLQGAEAWRSAFDPGREHRTLLYIHGFISDAQSLPRAWVQDFGSRYDAVLAYEHPTITQTPLENAAKLLAMIPEDVRMNVDLVAHSRGGLVVRSLVELHEAKPNINVTRLLTCGSPHAGTRLADPERWDRLISLGMTAASWLARTAGPGPVAFIPHLLEWVLRAAAQFIFELPGVSAMTPQGEFLQKLNAAGDAALFERVRYAAVSSTFDVLGVKQMGYRDALRSIAVQAFMGAENDLVVPTESMTSIDLPTKVIPNERLNKSNIHHFGYFDEPAVQDIARAILTGA